MSNVEKTFYENGKIEVLRNLENGDGIVQGFYKSGDLKFTVTYKDGLFHGAFIGYYKNGNIRYIAWYDRGVNVEDERKFSKKGVLACVITYRNGMRVKYEEFGG
jgi:antitoxin component YwqK of YwqJK toxin-antitoxin module